MLAKELARLLLQYPDAEIYVLENSNAPMFTEQVSVMYRYNYCCESIHIGSPRITENFISDFVKLK